MKNDNTIGIPVPVPSKACVDVNCPFHGSLKIHGRIFVGTVTKDVFHKTATLEFPRRIYLRKYERYERRRTRVKAHVPECLDVRKGNTIRVAETRPLSKTKHCVVVEVMKQ